MLEITLFGVFDAKREGTSLHITNYRQANRLLALLTLHHAREISSIWIADTLGIPDSVLPQSLHELRERLGEADRERIVCRNSQIYFDTSGISVDIFKFEQLIAKNTQEALCEAVKKHRGKLLKDWEEEVWFAEERENYLADYCDAIRQLAKRASDDGDYDRAASLYHSRALAYPEMDSAWVLWIKAIGKAGNLSLAEPAYDEYRAALEKRSREEKRELKPSRQVAEVYQQVCGALFSAGTPYTASLPAAKGNPLASPQVLAPVGGDEPLGSPYYLSRPEDARVYTALAQRDSFILIKGARQVGKSSLLVRVQEQCRQSGRQVVRTNWQKLSQASLETAGTFLLDIADTFAEELELDTNLAVYFQGNRPAIKEFERFLKKAALPAVSQSLVWIIDETDRIFDTPFRDDIFAMLRSWHGERANDFTGLWQKLTVVIAYATEAHLFIQNLDQSPFNIGARFALEDFTYAQVEEMNGLYGTPLQTENERKRLYALVGGHPYLVRRSLQEMILRQMQLADVERQAEQESTIFSDHLRRLHLALSRDPDMQEALQGWLHKEQRLTQDAFLRLRAAGVIRGQEAQDARLRCRLYEIYLRRMIQP